MSEIYLHDQQIENVFQLLGDKENDISFSVGWALSRCSRFLTAFLKHTQIRVPFDTEKIVIRMQRFEQECGYTDFEIYQPAAFHVVIEAKRSWTFPDLDQLQKYARRVCFKDSNPKQRKMIVFNESTPELREAGFAIRQVDGIPVEGMSWGELKRVAVLAKQGSRLKERHLLDQLIQYLEWITIMQKHDSNRVYVVSLGSGSPDGWGISWRDIVSKYAKYFHPVGGGRGGWPRQPPNYIAFRYDGKLQTIHHIEQYEVVKRPSKLFKEAPAAPWDDPHYVYQLGPAMRPTRDVPAGPKIRRNLRVWAALDLLLTSETIQQARDLTVQRDTSDSVGV